MHAGFSDFQRFGGRGWGGGANSVRSDALLVALFRHPY